VAVVAKEYKQSFAKKVCSNLSEALTNTEIQHVSLHIHTHTFIYTYARDNHHLILEDLIHSYIICMS
jgi:hypothetical protein